MYCTSSRGVVYVRGVAVVKRLILYFLRANPPPVKFRSYATMDGLFVVAPFKPAERLLPDCSNFLVQAHQLLRLPTFFNPGGPGVRRVSKRLRIMSKSIVQ